LTTAVHKIVLASHIILLYTQTSTTEMPLSKNKPSQSMKPGNAKKQSGEGLQHWKTQKKLIK